MVSGEVRGGKVGGGEVKEGGGKRVKRAIIAVCSR